MKTIYCISGLGADQRIFSKLTIKDAQLVPIPWAQYDWHDDLPCFAQKMAAKIPGEDPIILGVSFGGMLASEIIRLRPSARVIIISSAKDVNELPPVGRFLRWIALRGLAPVGIMKLPSKQIFNRFGVKTEEEKGLLKSILADTDGGFMRWSMKAMIDWRTNTFDERIVHIHGTADKMIMPDNVHPTHWVEGGEHFMVYTRAAEVSALINRHLES